MAEGKSKQELERKLQDALLRKTICQGQIKPREQGLSAAQKELSQTSLSEARQSKLEKEVKDCEVEIQAFKKLLLGSEEEIKELQDALGQLTSASQKPDSSSQKETQNTSSSPVSTQNEPLTGFVSNEMLQHENACSKVIAEKICVDIGIIRLVYSGLPRSGKTCSRRRLMGEILNILMAMEKEQPSTGVVEEGGHVVIRNVHSDVGTIVSRRWSVLKDVLEEAGIYSQLFYETVKSGTTLAVGRDTASQSSVSDVDTRKQRVEDMEEILSLFREAMRNEEWGKVKYLLEDTILLINTDTGGHPEFLEMHAALVMGPSLYLLFSRLTDQLDSLFKVYYTNEEGVSTDPEDSTLTMEEVLFQSLSSIECFSERSLDSHDGPPVKRREFSGHFKSKAVFVGTHRDKVNDEEFKEKDGLLQKRIKNTSFYKNEIIEFVSEDQLMLAVNNYDGDQEEIEEIRNVLERIIKRSFSKITIPAAWLMLSLYVRKLNLRVMSLVECEELGGKLGISPSELQEALWFLHHCVGLILYYPELDSLKDTVICDVQVLFDSVTNLVKKTFTFEKVGKRVAERFREKAQFSLKDLKSATSSCTDAPIPLEKLVELLEYLNILARFTPTSPTGASSTQEEVYFMPSILKSARASELTVETSNEDPAPLLLRYDCGYVPLGTFSYMIANIVSQHSKDWKLVERTIRKNKVEFHVWKNYDKITLISRPLYLEVAITRRQQHRKPVSQTKMLCSHVRGVVQSTLKTVTSRLNYKFMMKYKFAFKCPIHSSTDHLCVLAEESAPCMECLQDPQQIEPVDLKPKHTIWFEEECGVQPFNVSAVLGPPDHFETSRLLKALSNDELIELGTALGLSFSNLKRMTMLLGDMIQAWLNGDDDITTRSGPPSWTSLATALERTGHTTIASKVRKEKLSQVLTTPSPPRPTPAGPSVNPLPDEVDKELT